MTKEQVISEIVRACNDMGENPCEYIAFAQIESNFNPKASNGSYQGLFQLGNGVGGCKGNDRLDVYKATKCAITYKNYNKKILEKGGYGWDAPYAYLAHQQGAGGLQYLLKNLNSKIGNMTPARSKALLGNIPRSAGITKESLGRDWMAYWTKRYKDITGTCTWQCGLSGLSNAPADDNSGSNCDVTFENQQYNYQNNPSPVNTDNSNWAPSAKRSYYLKKIS